MEGKRYALVLFSKSLVIFLGKREDAGFCPFSLLCSGYLQHCSIEGVGHQISLSSLLLVVIHRLAIFLFLIFVCTTWGSSWINCSSLMSSWLLIIFMIGLSVTLGDFPRRYVKCSFYMCICSFWLAAFSLALEELFLLLTSFTVRHAIWDCLSSTEFLILLIWPWMYSICSFWYALIYSLCAFLSFCVLVLVGFLLLHRDAVSTLSRFFLTANVSQRTQCLALSLVGIHSAAASMWALMKFSYLSFGVSVSDISWRVLDLFLSVIIYLSQYLYC